MMNPENIDNLFPGEINTEHFIGGAIKRAFKTIVSPLIRPILKIPLLVVNAFVDKFIIPLINTFFSTISTFFFKLVKVALKFIITIVKLIFLFFLLIIVYVLNLDIGGKNYHKHNKEHEYKTEYPIYKVTTSNNSPDAFTYHSKITLNQSYKIKHAVAHFSVLTFQIIYKFPKLMYNVFMYLMVTGIWRYDKKFLDGAIASFAYKYIYACENNSNDWYQTVGYHYDNKNERKLFYNVKKCSKGYIPDESGLHCVKLNSFEPQVCPQANIYRIHKNDKIYNTLHPLLPRDFDTVKSPQYYNKTVDEQNKEKTEYINNKTNYYTTCARKMSNYDLISENICRTFDYESTKNNRNTDDLQKLCVDTYCKHGRYETFCGKFKEVEQKIDKHDTNLENKKLRKFYYSLTLLTLLSAISIIIFTKSGAVDQLL